MSDPVSLSLAIAPLAIEAFKGFRTLNSKLRIFSHYSQELKRIRTRFEAQQDFFQSECEIPLGKVTDSQTRVEAFLRARQLDDDCYDTLKRLCTYLGARQNAFKSTFEEIKASLQDLEAELHGFEQFESKRQDGESLRDAVRRLRYRLKITINKTNYDEALERLKQSNYDLKSIRKHAQELRRDLSCGQDVVNDMKPLPLECRHFGRVRLAALAFHEAMVSHWVCEERKHQRHLIRLFTNAEVQHDVRMNFFLLGEWKLPEAIGSKRLDLISLEVRSTIFECSEPLELENREMQSKLRKATIDSRLVKRRRVRWADETSTSTTSYTHPLSNSKKHNPIAHKGGNAGSKAQDYQCNDIPGCIIATQQLRGPACLGHLDVEMQNPFRHSFYPWSGTCNRSMTVAKAFATAKPLTNLFDQPVHKNFDILDQLLMAKTMVATILKFHSTPWLRSWWTLKDIHYLGNHTEMASVLSTLHLGAVIEKKQKQVCEQREPLPLTQAVAEDSGLSQRIRNTVLHNLGVGLLQIDRWTNLDPNAIDDIDKLATQRSRLGPKYRDLVQKCLYCDFGVGANLLKPQLQTAILDKVMRELESMVSGLKINDDDEEGEHGKVGIGDWK
ncbi:hypothetical protein HD806DRAFT_507301 [Xylariaceae sp. AK1471]|nr:hypothetical protein HD806DRAFT_507301 [Xylariaceae sp. AK1471]